MTLTGFFNLLPGMLLAAAAFWPVAGMAQIDAHDDETLQEIIVSPPPGETSTTRRILRGLERGHDYISKGVGYIGEGADEWLAGDVETDKKNRSYIRLRLQQDIYKAGEREGDYSFRGHLDLPRTKKRWRLFFDTDSSDLDTLAEKKLLHQNSGEQVTGISRDSTKDWFSIRHDVGLRGDFPLDSFYRFRFKTGTPLNEQWRADFEQRAWYYHSKRWGEKSQLRFSRQLDAGRILAISTDLQYQDRYDMFEFAQYVSLLRALGPMENLRYEAGAIGGSKPEHEINQYYLLTTWSRSLHEDWLILSVTPQLAFPRSDDWKPNPGLFFTLDIYFYAL